MYLIDLCQEQHALKKECSVGGRPMYTLFMDHFAIYGTMLWSLSGQPVIILGF